MGPREEKEERPTAELALAAVSATDTTPSSGIGVHPHRDRAVQRGSHGGNQGGSQGGSRGGGLGGGRGATTGRIR